MRRTTALLVVTLLAGSPGLSLACELWCSTSAAEAHHSAVGCHQSPLDGIPDVPAVSAAADCHGSPALAAFLAESRPPDIRSVLVGSAAHDTPAGNVRREVAREGWLVFNGRSSPATFRTILRI